jgi:uncharacterized protein (TIGR03435 family)
VREVGRLPQHYSTLNASSAESVIEVTWLPCGLAEFLVSFCATLFAQQAAGPPAFEVASIKTSLEPPGSVVGIFESKGRISAKNVTLKRCVRGAYDLPEPQIIGGPKWVDQDRYNIEAKANVPAGDHELMVMLQALLADRFKLVLHRERRDVSGYRLVLGKGGLKAQPSAPDRDSVGYSQRGRMEATGCTMAQLALKLAEVLHQPVLDATGVAGKFDLKLEWAPDDMQAQPPSADQRPRNAPDSTAPSIFAALQEQLGLKLESGKVPADVLVIDSAVKPSEN